MVDYVTSTSAEKKHNKRSGKIPGKDIILDRVGIEPRPDSVDRKERLGDFEADTIRSAKRQRYLVSFVDSKTKLTRLRLVSSAIAVLTSNAIVHLLAP
jgi:IS30 family transposase